MEAKIMKYHFLSGYVGNILAEDQNQSELLHTFSIAIASGTIQKPGSWCLTICTFFSSYLLFASFLSVSKKREKLHSIHHTIFSCCVLVLQLVRKTALASFCLALFILTNSKNNRLGCMPAAFTLTDKLTSLPEEKAPRSDSLLLGKCVHFCALYHFTRRNHVLPGILL